jgi:methyl-accepting chemotaxis protein
MFRNFKLRTNILIGYSVPITLFILAALLVLMDVKKIEEASRLADISREIGTNADQLEIAIGSMIRGTQGYILFPSNANKNILAKSDRDFFRALERLKLLVKDSDQTARLSQLQSLQKDIADLSREAIALADQGNAEGAVNLLKSDKNTEIWNTFEELMQAFAQNQQAILEQRLALQSSLLQRLSIIVGSSSLTAAVIAIILGVWIAARISNLLSHSVNTLASSSAEISATLDQHERTVLQQTSSVSETTSTTEELRISAQTSAEQAENAAAAVKKALQLAEEGSRSSESASEYMKDLQDKVRAVAEQILQLSEQAGHIGGIAKVVGELASETNMLALNAAVEAARAGENGKGFAVVAGEIRKLADQSKKSAERANALVSEIQKATNSAVMVAEAGSKTAQEVFNIAMQNGKTFYALAQHSSLIDQNAQQILLNSRQQAGALSQISEAMRNLNNGAAEMTTGTRQTRLGLVNLANVAKSLQAMI